MYRYSSLAPGKTSLLDRSLDTDVIAWWGRSDKGVRWSGIRVRASGKAIVIGQEGWRWKVAREQSEQVEPEKVALFGPIFLWRQGQAAAKHAARGFFGAPSKISFPASATLLADHRPSYMANLPSVPSHAGPPTPMLPCYSTMRCWDTDFWNDPKKLFFQLSTRPIKQLLRLSFSCVLSLTPSLCLYARWS